MKPIRLAPEAYRLGHAFSLTIVTAGGSVVQFVKHIIGSEGVVPDR